MASKSFVAQKDIEVDKNKYIWIIRLVDLYVTTPFIILGFIGMRLLYKMGINPFTDGILSFLYIFPLLPAVIVFLACTVEHEEYKRKNIKLMNWAIYKYKFNKQKKVYEKTNKKIITRGDFMEDIRSQIGLYDISGENYETLEDKIVKVIEVQPINVTSLPRRDQQTIYEAFENFLKDLPSKIQPIQIMNTTKPVSLKDYITYCKEVFSDKDDKFDRMFGESYIDLANSIQKNKNMVSKSFYVCVGLSNKNKKNYDLLELYTEQIVDKLNNMLPSQFSLSARTLNNEELFDLIHQKIDYSSAQVKNDDKEYHDLVIFGSKETKEFEDYWNEHNKTHIL
ncbi:hypothetical protein CW670_10865 [Macrococcoides caseolyticum]|uniref:hypothetical protein n=1 Tax=Macrococcoides caseolyticum TaxID=69966 RepID=UPI000C32A160|nr:hypothetical protein [Macrococcus caseolyticus]PKE73632.1 hypothetical protein CW670_10865 [Macrococcus caseolyticus]